MCNFSKLCCYCSFSRRLNAMITFQPHNMHTHTHAHTRTHTHTHAHAHVKLTASTRNFQPGIDRSVPDLQNRVLVSIHRARKRRRIACHHTGVPCHQRVCSLVSSAPYAKCPLVYNEVVVENFWLFEGHIIPFQMRTYIGIDHI